MDKIQIRIAHEIKMYSRHMSLEAAIKKVKAARLGRVDFIVDEVAAKIGGSAA